MANTADQQQEEPKLIPRWMMGSNGRVQDSREFLRPHVLSMDTVALDPYLRVRFRPGYRASRNRVTDPQGVTIFTIERPSGKPPYLVPASPEERTM